MVSSFSTRKRLEKQNPGENSNTWGGYLNTNTIDMIDECFGLVCVAMTTAGDSTLSTANGATDAGRRSQIVLTGAPTSNVSLFAPAVQSFYLVRNKMTGSNKVTLKNAGGLVGVDFSGSGAGAEQGIVMSDGTVVREVLRTVSIGGFSAFTSAAIAAVSNVPTDATGGNISDIVPFFDASESGAPLNKVTVQSLFNNALSSFPAKTTVGATDQFLMLNQDTSVANVVTGANFFKGINSLTADTQPDGTNDFVATYDNSAAGSKKVALKNLNSPGASAKTGNYTVLDTDRNTLIRFSGLSADATLTLPAASGRAGFILYVVNDDTGFFGVTIDPNSSELLDGFSSRKAYVGSRLTLLCDGTGWRTVAGQYRFISAAFTPTAAATTGALAHGLGVIPNNIQVQITAVNAVVGYSVGEIIHLSVTGDSNVSGGMSILKDATNITIRVASAGLVIPHKTTGVQTGLTGTDWSARVIAED